MLIDVNRFLFAVVARATCSRLVRCAYGYIGLPTQHNQSMFHRFPLFSSIDEYDFQPTDIMPQLLTKAFQPMTTLTLESTADHATLRSITTTQLGRMISVSLFLPFNKAQSSTHNVSSAHASASCLHLFRLLLSLHWSIWLQHILVYICWWFLWMTMTVV